MKPLKIYVCEDEDISLGINKVVLEKILQKKNITADITCCHNYNQQDDSFFADVELAILDIDLEGSTINGIQLAKKILERNPCTVFIFITSHEEFAHEATQIHLSGFLDKPLNQYDFEDALNRAIIQINGYRLKNINRNMATFQKGKFCLKERSIISVEKLPHTHEVIVRTTENKIQAYDSIKDTEKRLSSDFVKLNGSVIVNLAYVFHIEGNLVIMRGGFKYNITMRNQEKVKKAYENYITRKLV
ncbi:LytR/AlgR family response regulator transcription factor [[Clostridium] polysaccharolyticum]|uniref:Stage 0 sporulation protein A homolog n=1 Tax=[Clostridium] polysaccharolyticum TaxID=29364 RepID=A0A1I0CB85_9FIRM|nr:LytTR family DNA-binding domain-containing protein [[Clostridium] polysaccharolyticum]SET16710.1 two component transcriptional regulator, LytTR family [[Clostridium] polysaccharolyticum]